MRSRSAAGAPLDDESPLVGLPVLRVLADAELIEQDEVDPAVIVRAYVDMVGGMARPSLDQFVALLIAGRRTLHLATLKRG